MFIFAIGGGSDFYSATLIARSLQFVDYTIFTSLAPEMLGDQIDIPSTIEKYSNRAEYTLFSEDGWPLFRDNRGPSAYGLVVTSPTAGEAFESMLAKFTQVFPARVVDSELIAVDTGGDSLRGLVGGMGQNDVSDIFDNRVDTRDVNTIEFIRRISSGPLELYILGPGSDGETTDSELVSASGDLRRNSIPKVKLIRMGSMFEFLPLFDEVKGWQNPTPGSTIANIRRAMDCDDEVVKVELERRGVMVGSVSAKFLRSYWKLSIEQP